MFAEVIILAAYLIRSLRNILYHLFCWEIKEYRFDRMFVHLNETYQGKKWLFGPLSLVKWILLIFSIIINLDYLIYVVFIFEALKNITEVRNGWRTPPLKSRNKAVLLLTLLSLFFVLFILNTNGIRFAVALLIGDKLLGPIIALLILFTNIVFNIHKDLKINKAKEKIRQAEKLKIIGITGSYGKTTTKELIAQLLSQKFRVLKTLSSQNTDIGIAERILTSDLSKFDYFVCEMAAYKRGEIAAICSIFPQIDIGVITGINEQHQSLFGSLENTQKAKFELIEAIRPSGLAIINGNSKHIESMLKWAKEKDRKTIIAKAAINKLPLQIHGVHFQENLSLAISVAHAVGIKESEINKIMGNLHLPDKTMSVSKKGKFCIVDNTFNSNPDGVYTALNYLETYKGNKVLVLQPLIELGKYTAEIHKKIGKMAAKICDVIVLTNKNFYSSIIEGINEEKDGYKKVNMMVMPKVSGGVVLFQGKESEKYLKSLNSI